MANIKFSAFTAETNVSNVTEIVGLTAAGNIKISPANLLLEAGNGLAKNPSGALGSYSTGSSYFDSWAVGSTTRGNLCYWTGTGWADANATNDTKSSGILAVAGSPDGTVMIKDGVVVLNASSHLVTNGAILYASNITDGLITETAPTGTAGLIVRIVGYVIDASTNTAYINPDSSFITLA